MADKSCKTCEFGWDNNCRLRSCNDCPVADEFGFCKCVPAEYVENCPYYKKYEPASVATDTSLTSKNMSRKEVSK